MIKPDGVQRGLIGEVDMNSFSELITFKLLSFYY